MLKRVGLMALLVLVGIAFPTLRADELTGQPFVIAIGINQYADPQIKPRKHAEADARALVSWFLAKENLGVDKERVKLLLGSGDGKDSAVPVEKATRENILAALKWVEKSAKKDDLVLFAIFAQGAPLGERPCYFAVDSTFVNRAKDAITSSDILPIMEKLPSQRFVAFIDVNFLGFDPGKEKLPDVSTQKYYREFLGITDENSEDTPSRVIFMAGSPTKPSLDLETHGVFAKAILDGLRGDADTEGYEKDGNITVSELAKHVRKAVPELVRAQGKTEEEKKQKSGVFEFQASDFVVGFNAKAHALSVERLDKLEALAKEKKLDKKLAEEGHALLLRMPKLEAQQNLRKIYQKLADGAIDVAAFNTERASVLDTTRLSEQEAGKFAITILKAADMVNEGYYKKVAKEPLVEAAIKGLFDNVSEKIPSHLKERVGRIKDMTDAEMLRLVTEARQHLGKREDLAKGQDITYALKGMFSKLDKHTGYIPPEVVRRFRDDTAGSFKGIGVQIRKNDVRDELQVITPIFGSPAHKAGLKANDIIKTIIAEVDPQTGRPYEKPEIISTKGLAIDEAVKKIQGREGTKVKLIIEREGVAKPIEFTLIRGTIEVESVLGYKRDQKDAWNYVIDPENKICYVRLTQFSENSYAELEKVMKKLYADGIKGFILDLRFNPGGLLESSIKMSDLFIDDGLIVTVRHRDGSETSYVGRSDGSYTTFPMVCLINSGSASASEIVSACLQDHGRAIIMGSRSFGKGSVQSIHGFDNKSIIKLTSSTFWRPSNRNLNKSSTKGRDEDEWGVTPDRGFEIKLSQKEEDDLFEHLRELELIRAGPDHKSAFQDRQLNLAVDYLRGQIRTAARKDAVRDVESR